MRCKPATRDTEYVVQRARQPGNSLAGLILAEAAAPRLPKTGLKIPSGKKLERPRLSEAIFFFQDARQIFTRISGHDRA
jgi:hypothetical protein